MSFTQDGITLHLGAALDVLKRFKDKSVNCCITSLPSWGVRDYTREAPAGVIGLEPTVDDYLVSMLDVFTEIRRVLVDEGTLWFTVEDAYATETDNIGLMKAKDLIAIPWRAAMMAQVDGWYLRSDVILNIAMPMPEAVNDRPTMSHRHLFLLSKSARYYYDAAAIAESDAYADDRFVSVRDSRRGLELGAINVGIEEKDLGAKNRRTVWDVAEHMNGMPPEVISRCIAAGCSKGGIVLDPFFDAGAVGVECKRLGVQFVGVEVMPDKYAAAEDYFRQGVLFQGA